MLSTGNPVPQIGLCVAGQTIYQAIACIKKIPYFNKHVIINLGMVDLLYGSNLNCMIDDTEELVSILKSLGCQRIIMTTLTPLVNKYLFVNCREILMAYNEYLRRNFEVIDLYDLMANKWGEINYRLYCK
jgi:hypothetical protein